MGNLKKIHIRHDNQGLGPAWFLDKVYIFIHLFSIKYKINHFNLVSGWLVVWDLICADICFCCTGNSYLRNAMVQTDCFVLQWVCEIRETARKESSRMKGKETSKFHWKSCLVIKWLQHLCIFQIQQTKKLNWAWCLMS